MKTQKNMLGFLAMAMVFAVLGCSNPVAAPTALGSDKAIIAFGFADPEAVGVITGTTRSVAVTVPSGTDVAALAPTIVISGLSVSPASGASQDFTNPVTYTVTAADGSTMAYTATVTVAVPAAMSSITTISSGLDVSAFGSSVTFTATVEPATATGTVTFRDGGTTLGTGTLSGGVATFGTSGLGLGSHSISAEYSGDGRHNVSASATHAHRVGSGAAKDGNWSDPATWSCGTVPEAGTDVIIGTGLSVVVDTDTAALGNLTILGTLTVPGAQTITVSGNLTNNGAFNPGAGYVLSGPFGSGAPTTATFPAAGAKLLFPSGLPQTSLTLATSTTSTISANITSLPGVRGIKNQYAEIKSTASITGAFTLVIDYSVALAACTPTNITSVKFLSRENAASAWVDITTLGATITNRFTDGVQGKFTIEWTWPSCFNR